MVCSNRSFEKRGFSNCSTAPIGRLLAQSWWPSDRSEMIIRFNWRHTPFNVVSSLEEVTYWTPSQIVLVNYELLGQVGNFSLQRIQFIFEIFQLCFYDVIKAQLLTTGYFGDNTATHFTASLCAVRIVKVLYLFLKL